MAFGDGWGSGVTTEVRVLAGSPAGTGWLQAFWLDAPLDGPERQMPTASRVTGDCGGSSHGQGRLCGRGRGGSAALQLVLPNQGVDNNPYHTFRACAGLRGTITITLTTPPALLPVCARPSVSTLPICPPSKREFPRCILTRSCCRIDHVRRTRERGFRRWSSSSSSPQEAG